MNKKFLLLFFVTISLNVTSSEKYPTINNILLSDNIFIEHKTINKISNNCYYNISRINVNHKIVWRYCLDLNIYHQLIY